jgi:POT family proton-dependent oligopeptide transporter
MSDAIETDGHGEFVPSGNPFTRLGQHPIGFWFVFSGELAERASYYGMRTLLALYMIDVLGFSEAAGATVMKAFMASCYLTPFFGGWVAEKYLGRYKTILYYSLPYILGHVILGGFQNRVGLAVALVLLAFGSGAIKPNTSVLMGQIYDAEKKDALLNEAFSLFYAAVNVGAALSSFTLPLIVRQQNGRYGLALVIPAVLMALAFGAFALGKPWYPSENVRAARPPKTREQREAERRTLLRIGGVFAAIAVFWLIYDQNADTWIYFAQSHTDLHLFGSVGLTSNQMQALNPVFIVLLTPVFNYIWNRARRLRGGREVADTRKMLIGFGIVVVTSVIMAYAAWLARNGAIVTVWWVILATFVITLAELCISPVGLEFAYRQAVPGTKSVVTAAFLMTVFVGDSIGLAFAPFYEKDLKPAFYFGLLAVIMTLTALVFIPISRKFERGPSPAPAPPGM